MSFMAIRWKTYGFDPLRTWTWLKIAEDCFKARILMSLSQRINQNLSQELKRDRDVIDPKYLKVGSHRFLYASSNIAQLMEITRCIVTMTHLLFSQFDGFLDSIFSCRRTLAPHLTLYCSFAKPLWTCIWFFAHLWICLEPLKLSWSVNMGMANRLPHLT